MKKNPPGWRAGQKVSLPDTGIAPGTPKVNLRPQDFDNLIKQQGVRVKVYRSVYCPNVKSIDGAEHEIDCPICNGSQFVDRLPVETMGFIQNQIQEGQNHAEGRYDGNTVAATFLQGVELQYFTLVELLDFTELFFERIKRQQGDVDILKYPATKVNFLIDADGREYLEGSDFRLDANGNLAWCFGKSPDRGMIYSVHYDMAIRFRATSAMHSNRFANVSVGSSSTMIKMNEQWQLTKDFLVVRKDQEGNTLKNKIRDEDTLDRL